MKPKKLSDRRMYTVLTRLFRRVASIDPGTSQMVVISTLDTCRDHYPQAKELSRFGLICEIGFGYFKGVDEPEVKAHVEKLIKDFEKENNI